MEPCLDYLEWMNAVLDGEATLEQEEALAAHLAVCPACAALYQDLAALRQGADALVVSPPERFTASVMAAVRANPSPAPVSNKTPARRWRPVAAVCALALLGTGSLNYLKSWSTAGSQTPAAENMPIPMPASAEAHLEVAPAAAPDKEDAGEPAPSLSRQASKNSSAPVSGGTTEATLPTAGAGQPLPSSDPDLPAHSREAGTADLGGYADQFPAQTLPETVSVSRTLSEEEAAPSEYRYSVTEEAASDGAQADASLPQTWEVFSDQAPLFAPAGQSEAEAVAETAAAAEAEAEVPLSQPAPAEASEPHPALLTPAQALQRVVEYLYGGAQCPAQPADDDSEEPLSCPVSLPGGTQATEGGMVTYTGLSPNGRFYTFAWTWEGQNPDEAALFRYAVHTEEAYVMWLGEAADGGARFRAALGEE